MTKPPVASEPQLIKVAGAEPGLAKARVAAALPADGQPNGAAQVLQAAELPLPLPQVAAAVPSPARGELPPRDANGFAQDGIGERNTNPPPMTAPPSLAPLHRTTPSPAP